MEFTDIKINGVSTPWFHVDSNTQISFLTPVSSTSGTYDVYVYWDGGSTKLGSTPSYTYNASSLKLAPDSNPSKYGTNVVYTATGGTPSDTAYFRVDGTLVYTTTFNGSGVATYTASSLTAANHRVTVEDNGKLTVGLDQVVMSNPTITSASSYSFTQGTSGSFTFTTSGFPTASFKPVTLPAGLTFLDNLDGTATISGTPLEYSSTSLSVIASNGSGTDATQTFTLNVNSPSSFSSVNSALASEGQAFSFLVVATGFPNATMTKSGSLPSGLTWTDNGNGTATISGTPATSSAGTYTLTLTATNGIGSAPTQTFTLTVKAPISVVSITPNANVSSLTTQHFSDSGFITQRSRVVSLVVVFNQAVELTTDNINLSLHTKNVHFNGTTYTNGYGSLPTSLALSTSDNITWVVTFVGNTDNGSDGYNSIKDGVYDFSLNSVYYYGYGPGTPTMAPSTQFTFYRLYGDVQGISSSTSGGVTTYTTSVNGTESLYFYFATTNPEYVAAFDFDGSGNNSWSTDDWNILSNNYNKVLTWDI